MSINEARETLRQRRDWLTARIRAKESIGWDVEWDTRERDALSVLLSADDPMNDDEALKHLESLMQHDTEEDHSIADRVLCDLLTSLGYEKTVAFYRELDKWYA